MGFSLLALALWFITNSTDIGIFFAILSDAIAGYLTFAKALKYPQTETVYVYIVGTSTQVVAFLLLPVWNFTSLAFLLYNICMNILIFVAISRRYLPNFQPAEPPK